MQPATLRSFQACSLIALVALAGGLLVIADTGAASETVRSVPSDEDAPRDLNLNGSLYDADTGEPVSADRIHVQNTWTAEGDDGVEHRSWDRQSIQPDEDGFYSANVSQGEIRLHVDSDGYKELTAEFEIEDDLTVDLPMERPDEDPAIVEGTVRSSNGTPLEDARIRVSTDDAHREPGTDERTTRADGQEVKLRYRSTLQTYASATTDANGTYRAEVAPGSYELRASARDHVTDRATLELSSGQTSTVEIALKALPDASVTVEGTIVDEDTGEPVPLAQIHLVNDRWGDRQRFHADQDGTFEASALPGPLVLKVDADDRSRVPCEEAPEHAEEPRYGGCQIDRDPGYLPRVRMLTAEANETVEIEIQLREAPGADATLSGWVINETSEEGIENASVRVRNEVTGDAGSATTDANGSFTIDVPSGYYTVVAEHPEHPVAVTNAEVASGEEERLTLEAPPGPVYESSRAHARPAHDAQAVSETGDAAEDGARSSGPSSSGLETSSGSEEYEGSGGGLGPYPGGEDQDQVPLPGPMVLLVGMVLVSLFRRRWES